MSALSATPDIKSNQLCALMATTLQASRNAMTSQGRCQELQVEIDKCRTQMQALVKEKEGLDLEVQGLRTSTGALKDKFALAEKQVLQLTEAIQLCREHEQDLTANLDQARSQLAASQQALVAAQTAHEVALADLQRRAAAQKAEAVDYAGRYATLLAEARTLRREYQNENVGHNVVSGWMAAGGGLALCVAWPPVAVAAALGLIGLGGQRASRNQAMEERMRWVALQIRFLEGKLGKPALPDDFFDLSRIQVTLPKPASTTLNSLSKTPE